MTGGQFFASDDVTKLTSAFVQVAQRNLAEGSKSANVQMKIKDRLIGWGLLGLLIGLTVTLIKKGQGMFPKGFGALDALIIGIFGGCLGGILGGLGFLLIDMTKLAGTNARGVGFAIMGLCFGLAIYAVEELYRRLRAG